MLGILDLIVLSISAYGFYHAIQLIRGSKLNFKPFNCKICLSFWYAIGVSIFYQYLAVKIIVLSFFVVSITYIFGLIEKLIEEDKYDSI